MILAYRSAYAKQFLRMDIARETLTMFSDDPDLSEKVIQTLTFLNDLGTSKHVYDIATSDESCIYTCEPESKQQSTVWVLQDEPKPTKVAPARSTSKQIITCFFGKTGYVAIVLQKQGRIVNSE